ncbi:MAG: exonuclease [Alphaproteobacteria bacterium]|nr:exonuclease [Alphaproteobacteria bacterium]
MQKEVVVFDTEFTAWAGSMERNWSGPGEFREIVQIGAVRIDAETLTETASFAVLIRPVKNPVLSDYFIDLTRITNERLAAEGGDFATGAAAFAAFVGKRRMYCYGRDDRVIARNAELLGKPQLWTNTMAVNLREWLVEVGIVLAGVSSGTLAKHVGSASQGRAHDALIDARSLAEAVRYLVKNGAPNPYR